MSAGAMPFVRNSGGDSSRVGLVALGGHDAASHGRPAFTLWATQIIEPRSESEQARRPMVGRSNDLARNNALAAAALARARTSIVGSGLTCLPQIDAESLGLDREQANSWQLKAARLWCLAAHSTMFDLERRASFNDMAGLVCQAVLEDGEAFVFRHYVDRPGATFSTCFAVLPPGRISNPNNAPNTARLVDGIAIDKHGAPEIYHVREGSITDRGSLRWRPVAAHNAAGRPNILHLARVRKAGMVRGLPWFGPVMGHLKQLGRFTEAELMAAVIDACLVTQQKSDDGQGSAGLPAAGGDDDDDEGDRVIDPGTMIDLQPGEEIASYSPSRPSGRYAEFHRAIVTELGAALEMPAEVLLAHFSSSYSASRAALELAWQFFLTQRAWLVRNFAAPAYETVLAEAIAKGLLDAPGFDSDPMARQAWLGCTWLGPRMPAIDEKRTAEAAEIRVRNDFSSQADEVAARGGNWEDVQRQREFERQRSSTAAPSGARDDPAENPDDTPDKDVDDEPV